MNVLIIILVITLAAVLLYLYMVSPRMFHKPDRTPFLGVHYAHRGLFDNKSDAPENSLNAIRKAVKEGYGIEFDVQLSKDNKPVVFHDATLKRMCGRDGNVWDYTLEELQKMRLADSDQRIPAFEEVLKAVDGKVPVIIEYKMDRPDTKICSLGDKLLRTYKGAYCIESFHPSAVRWYRKNRPDVLRGQLSEDFAKNSNQHPALFIMTFLLTNVLTRPDFIAYRHKDEANVSRRICRRLGALSVAFTIKSREQYEKARDHFDLFIFDSFMLR